MSEPKFNLSDYTQEVLKIAEANGVAVDVAFQCFVANLATMKEHYKGASHLNYHQLGQQWNKLLNNEKLAQKAEAKARLSKYSRLGGKS